MAPFTDHDTQIVSAHTLSLESMLRRIAVDGHVYASGAAKRIAADTFPIEIQRKGLRDVSVFNGFCARHDRDLFACLETIPFRFTRQQNFMLAYRAAARECYLKRKQVESIPTAEDIARMHGITDKIRLNDAALIFQASSLRGAEEIEALKATLDGYLVNESWGRLVTHAILFPKTPSALATAVFQPFFDLDGEQLQDFENLNAEMSQLAISVIPVETGGAAIFSWLDTANSGPKRFFESVLRGKDLTSSVLHAVLDSTENVALNPLWYEGLTKTQSDYIFSRMIIFSASITYSDKKRPDNSAPFLDDWGKATISEF